jgi:hypothetical protein
MRTAHHARARRATRQRPARRALCRPDRADYTLYTGLLDGDGLWSLYANSTLLAVAGDHRALAALMLCDAFPGCSVRSDLVDAFVEAWQLTDDGFVLPADLIAGWSLRWALDHPT